MANLAASSAAVADSADGLVPLRWRRPWRWPWLLGLVLGAVLVFQVLTLQRGGGGELAALLRGQLGPYLRQLLGYYVLFELVSGAVLLGVCGWYFQRCMPRALRPTTGGLLRHQLRFLPAALGSILVLGPLTNTLRYLAIHYPHYRWAGYFPEWFFTPAMFANYLLPVLLLSYGLLNANLLLDFYHWRSAPPSAPVPAPTPTGPAAPGLPGLTVFDAEGETLLPVRELRYVEVAAPKHYRAHGPGRHYTVRQTLAELEALLDPRVFFRLNRSVLVNLRYVRNYSYWENDKYIVRLTDGQTEFVMTRSRLRELRRRLAGLAAAPDAPAAAAEP